MRAVIAIVLGLVIGTPVANAQFEIEDATTASQQVKLEILNTIRTGSIATGSDRSVHEVGVKYGALRGWQPTLSFVLSNPTNDDFSMRGFRFGSTVALLGGELDDSAFALGFYSEVFYDFDVAGNRTVALGPAMAYQGPNWQAALNAFAEIPLNNGDTGLRYAFGGSYDVSRSIAVGAEAHGRVNRVFEDPDLDMDEHVVGPTVTLAFDADGADVKLRLGAFLGLTDVSPDVAVSANLGLGF